MNYEIQENFLRDRVREGTGEIGEVTNYQQGDEVPEP